MKKIVPEMVKGDGRCVGFPGNKASQFDRCSRICRPTAMLQVRPIGLLKECVCIGQFIYHPRIMSHTEQETATGPPGRI